MLVCFELFHAFCFDLPSHPFIPHAPCASGFWFAAHRQRGWRGRVEGGGGLPLTEKRLVLPMQGKSCSSGTITGCRVQWVEGSPGAKVMHSIQFSTPLLCSLRSRDSGKEFLCEKQLPQCFEGGLLTLYNMGKCIPQLVVI